MFVCRFGMDLVKWRLRAVQHSEVWILNTYIAKGCELMLNGSVLLAVLIRFSSASSKFRLSDSFTNKKPKQTYL